MELFILIGSELWSQTACSLQTNKSVKCLLEESLAQGLICFINLSCSSPAAYNAAPAAPQGYGQPVQSYGAGGYDSSSASTTTNSSQPSYGAQSGYGGQQAYPAYGQQPASTAPPRSAQYKMAALSHLVVDFYQEIMDEFISLSDRLLCLCT